MSKIVDGVLAANRVYSDNFGVKGQLEMPPAKRFAILTCMDARLDPAKFAGLTEGGFQDIVEYCNKTRPEIDEL